MDYDEKGVLMSDLMIPWAIFGGIVALGGLTTLIVAASEVDLDNLSKEERLIFRNCILCILGGVFLPLAVPLVTGWLIFASASPARKIVKAAFGRSKELTE